MPKVTSVEVTPNQVNDTLQRFSNLGWRFISQSATTNGSGTIGMINPMNHHVITGVTRGSTKIILFFENDDPEAKTPQEMVVEGRILKQKYSQNSRDLQSQIDAEAREERSKQKEQEKVLKVESRKRRDSDRENELLESTRQKIFENVATNRIRKLIVEKPMDAGTIKIAKWLDEKEDTRLAKLAKKHPHLISEIETYIEAQEVEQRKLGRAWKYDWLR